MALPAEKLPSPERVSVAEYLRREELATEKHEYIDGIIRPLGQLIAQSGGTFEHSRIVGNVLSGLHRRLSGSSCFPLDSSMRVAPPRSARYFYPDVTVVCGDPRFHPEDPKRTTITNPVVVVEVLSSSTEGFDRGGKFDHYRRMESLREYVLVEQVRQGVQTFFKQADGSWLFDASEATEEVVRLRSLEIDLRLVDVYAGVTFPDPATAALAQQQA